MEGYEIYRLSDEEIQHFGVKGMKWGMRKPSAKKLAKKDAKWEKKIESKKAVISARAYNHAVPKINSLVKTHQEKAKGWKESDPRWKSLEDEFGKEFESALNSYLNQTPDSVSPSGKKRAKAIMKDNLNFRIEVVDNN